MSNNKYAEKETALKEFLMDIDCLEELSPWTDRFNIFDVLKVSRTEIRHSNMLGWLLNPNENHGLGDAFLKGILQSILQNESSKKYSVFELLLSDLYSFTVYREWENIDILLVSSEVKMLIAIENKIGSAEHSNQLNRYRKILEEKYPDYYRMYFLLTPNGDVPSDEENWGILTYGEVETVLEDVISKTEVRDDILLMLKNYTEIIRRDIVEDKQLIEICEKIYVKHKKALDLIFENATSGKSLAYDAIKNALYKASEKDEIIYDKDWGITFRTKEMDKELPLLEEPISSWKSLNTYAYWLKLDNNRFYAIFELAGHNLTDEHVVRMNRIVDALGKKRRDEFKYYRVFKTKWYELKDDENLEVEAEMAINSAIHEIKKMEEIVISKISV